MTFGTGLWEMKSNAKRSLDHYLATLPETCRLIRGGRLVLFYEQPLILQAFEIAAARYGVTLHPIEVPIENLPAYAQSAQLLAGCQAMDLRPFAGQPGRAREKGVLHREREFDASGPDAYRGILSVWMSKIALMQQHVVTPNPFATPLFAWIDASVSRFNGRRQNSNVLSNAYADPVMYHYANRMLYQGAQLPLNASCLIAQSDVWARVDAAFQAKLEAHQDDPYAHDEETLLGLVYRDQPDLFQVIGQNYPSRQLRYRALPQRLRRAWENLRHRRQPD